MMSLYVTIPEDCHLVIDGVDYAGREVYKMEHYLDGTGSFQIDIYNVGRFGIWILNGESLLKFETITMNKEQNRQVMIAFCKRQIQYLKEQLAKEETRLVEMM